MEPKRDHESGPVVELTDVLDKLHGRPAINGKTGEFVRWAIGLLVAAIVSYATAMASINREIASLKATQESQFGEVLRRLEVMQADIRELRSR